MTKVTFTKTQDAPKVGEYKPTSIDQQKKEVDFLLLQVSPYVIEWKDGTRETITERKLNKLKSIHTWMTNF